ncbi:MAG: hypothetical protein ACXVAX_02885 [Pseudobdellovibrio sp.]
MKSFLVKFLRVLRAPNTYQRTIQAINKSPLRHLTKTIAILASFKVYKERQKLIQKEVLSSEEQLALEGLKARGFAEVTSLLKFDDLQKLLAYGTEKLDRVEEIRKTEITKTKDFWVRLSDEDIGGKVMDTDNPMLKVALNQSVLKTVGNYLKQAPFLEYVLLTLSNFAGPELKSSQLWHFDRDDTNMVKLFVYLTDVNSLADGPFTFVDKKNSEKVKNGFFMRHLPDAEFNRYSGESEYIRMIRPKLSCFLVDTSRCYHMGSRLYENHHRLLYTALFIGLPSNYSWAAKEKYSFAKNISLTELQQSALRRSV